MRLPPRKLPTPAPHLAVIAGREIAVSALREWAASRGPATHQAVAVSSAGKLKTASQLGALALLLASHAAVQAAGGAAEAALGAGLHWAASGGTALLILADALTLLSMAQYFDAARRALVR